jgi:tetratricopeptide (TPR) repeat protein
MAAKLSKQELNGPDAFQSTIDVITDYISENKKRFYSIVAAVILAALITFAIFLYWSNYQSSAREMYANAQNDVIQNAETPEAAMANIKIYEELVAKYPHSWSARMSRYHLGNLYYNIGDMDKAIASYKKFVSSRISDNAGMKFLALSSIGYCYEAKQDIQSALEYFEKAQKSNNVGFESIGFRNIARTYEQLNEKEKALENYKKALEKTSDQTMVLFIKHKISSLS